MHLFKGWLTKGAHHRPTLLRNKVVLALVTLHALQLSPIPGNPWNGFDPEAGPEPVRWVSRTSSPAASGQAAYPGWLDTGIY